MKNCYASSHKLGEWGEKNAPTDFWLIVMPYHPLYCEASHKDQDSGEYNPANLAFVILLVNAALQQLPMLKDWDAHRWSVILASLYSFYFRKYLFPQSAENSIKYGPSC